MLGLNQYCISVEHSVFGKSSGEKKEMESFDETGSIRQTAAYPRYATELSRLRTFDEWPKQLKQKPDQLADAGLFYTKRSDRVVCFSCGGGLSAWEDDDDPWEQHALYNDRCQYMQLIKGESYHDEVVTKLAAARIAKKFGKSLNEVWPSSETISPPISAIADDNQMCCSKWTNKLNEHKKCKICFENEYNTAFIPCGHIIACAKCASSVATCPMCRKAFTNIAKVYFP